jgi:hypothetical protein
MRWAGAALPGIAASMKSGDKRCSCLPIRRRSEMLTRDKDGIAGLLARFAATLR